MKSRQPERFDEFMRRALHDSTRGYYARGIRSIGGRGDFTTAPMMSPLPARSIAAWAAKALRETGCRDLIEIGPGEGVLAAQVMKLLPWSLRWKTRLHLVETSSPLAETQKTHLQHKATWHQHPAETLRACNGNAVIFSNELVDAFPVRRFEKTENGWQECAVIFDNSGRATESLLPPARLPESSSFSHPHPHGQRIEVHDSYHSWLLDWLPLWKTGRMLTIDYGSTAGKLYHRRPHGTLRGYLMHQRVEGPGIYQNIGLQDLTADVNFTDLAAWSAPWTSESKLTTFADFLTEFSKSATGKDLRLADPAGAGGAFMVLDQNCA